MRRNEDVINFIKYSLIFGIGVSLSVYLLDSNNGLSKLLFLLSIGLYALIVVGEVFASARRITYRDMNTRYNYLSEIQSLENELKVLEKSIRSNYMLHYLKDLVLERIRIKYGNINFDNYEKMKNIVVDDKVLRLLTDKNFSISSLDEVEDILIRIERCCK